MHLSLINFIVVGFWDRNTHIADQSSLELSIVGRAPDLILQIPDPLLQGGQLAPQLALLGVQVGDVLLHPIA